MIGEVGTPVGLNVAFKLGAGIAVCNKACFASIAFEAGPVEASAFGKGSDGFVEGFGHGVSGIGFVSWVLKV